MLGFGPGPAGALVEVEGVLLPVGAGADDGVEPAGVGAGPAEPQTQPQAPDGIFWHEASLGATHLPPLALGKCLWQSFLATSPLTGQFLPAGMRPLPTQMGPWMQYVASPTTLTSVQAFTGAGLGLLEGGVGGVEVGFDVGLGPGTVVVELGVLVG